MTRRREPASHTPPTQPVPPASGIELPEDFKITELGPLPEEWEVLRLGALFEIQQGKALSPRTRAGGRKRPFLRTANVLWGRVDLSVLDEMHFDEEEEARLALVPGDLLVCEGGDIGRTAIWEGQLPVVLYQNHLHRLRPARAGVDPLFYMYWMQAAWLLLGFYGGAGNKTTIPNLSRSRLAAFPVPLPPLPEQRAIAHVLRTVQRAKEATEGVIAALKELKKSLMQHLFTYGPVPVTERERVALQETEIGPLPSHWRVVRLGEMVQSTQYGLSKRGSVGGKYPILRMNNLVEGRVEPTDIQFVDLDNATFSRFRLNPGDLLFNRTNSLELVGKTGLFELEGTFVFASYLIRIVPKQECLEGAFLNYYLNWDSSQSRLKGLASRGVSQANISATRLRGFLIPLPPLPEQREIACILQAVDAKIAAEQARRAALEEVFKTLLHQLMTGKIRVKGFHLSDLQWTP
jgi:type I restriction enzyme S subunit